MKCENNTNYNLLVKLADDVDNIQDSKGYKPKITI